MTLEQKIDSVKNILIEEYIKNDGKIFISFSGGKDSTVLKHIAESIIPDIQIVFSNTTNELVEIYKYVKQFKNVIHVTPKMSFIEVVENYGFPAVSKEVSQKVSELKYTNGETTRNTRLHGDSKGNGKLPDKWRFLAEQDFDVTHKCCQILKKNPLEKWAKDNEMKPVIALMSDESALRKQLALFGTGEKKCYPFLMTDWNESDIWAYANKFNIRFAECYYDRMEDGVLIKARKRTGCEYCAFGVHLEESDRFERSRLVSPKRYEKMMNIQNNGVRFFDVIQLIKSKELPRPELDLYGIAITESIKNKISNFFFVEKRNQIKRCAHCDSTKLKVVSQFKQSYFDIPSEGVAKKIWVTREEISCKECGSMFTSKTPMINDDLNCTNRFVEYIDKIKDEKSFEEISELTMVNKSSLFKILRYILDGQTSTH